MEQKKTFTPKFIASVGILAAISVVLFMTLETPLPFMPPFLKLDFSNIPALIGGFAFGPLAGVFIALVKSLLHLIRTQTGGVGELADFITAASFIFTSSIIYKKTKSRKGAIIGLCAGSVAIAIVGALANYFILIPFYSHTTPLEQIFELCGKINPLVKSKITYVLYGAIPFNLLKGVILSAITFIIYKKVSKILH